ncbi:MAG TPA: EamA family transporter [Chloroflexota bacterium]|nr:EamA family transporter [Chloroflexota bacterium]
MLTAPAKVHVALRVEVLSQEARAATSPLPSPAARLREAAGAMPPTGLILMSILSVQVGAALAKGLFATLGPGGTVFLRIGFAALIMLALGRPRIRGHARADYVAMVLFGLTIAGMNLAFYSAIARIPLGIAVTLEFVGPLCVAVAGSRHRLDLLWAAFAAAGILLLAPWGNAAIDPLGVVLALIAAGGWAAYILLNVRVGRAFPGQSGLAMAMGISCLVTLPLGISASGPLLGDPRLLAAGLGVAVLSTVIPFSLEHAALKRLPAQVFGVLMSLEPGVATLVGAIILHQALGLRALLALAGVTLASVGSARSSAGD